MIGPFNVFRQARVFKRTTNGQYIDGKWVEDQSPTDVPVIASLQPLKPNELKQLPEGRRTNQSYKMYMDTELQTVTSQNPDTIVVAGKEFEVFSVASWQNNLINHYKAIIVAKDGNP
jgi:hypothetical protein